MTSAHSIIATVKTIASGAEHFGWIPHTMREIDRALRFTAGGPLFTPTDLQRTNLRAWVTATDHRIGTAEGGTDTDPFGFLPVAAEVAQLTDDELTALYQDRRRTVEHNRYNVRAAHQVPSTELHLMAELFETGAQGATSESSTPAPEPSFGDAERTAQYTAAARALRAAPEPEGFVIWDRINHMYVIAQHHATRAGASAEAARLNAQHRKLYSATP
ncbi:hypothetical protein [Streptomyces sp. DH10]|uniref:hypothetical protein n=1 Tax=Streptomyces sp. DH10 TaxID=3040121 RepID=UPI00244269F8|nr:hypothetical protein [Streptomyces sp. DH10]MDG9709780.1 hypothetical protein [Streptomyces sp. DH10]